MGDVVWQWSLAHRGEYKHEEPNLCLHKTPQKHFQKNVLKIPGRHRPFVKNFAKSKPNLLSAMENILTSPTSVEISKLLSSVYSIF